MTLGLLGPKKYTVTLMEIHKNISGNSSLQAYITMHETTESQAKWQCILRYPERQVT